MWADFSGHGWTYSVGFEKEGVVLWQCGTQNVRHEMLFLSLRLSSPLISHHQHLTVTPMH